jgi:parallel beta-helix repeat protein
VAKDAEDIAITGPGILDGNGDVFFDFQRPHLGLDFNPALTRQGPLLANPRYCLDEGPFLAKAGWIDRPGTLAVFWNCRRVRLEGVTIRNAPNWTVHFQDCDDVRAAGVTIVNSFLLPNDDGIDVYDSRNVRISDCLIHSGDDCIAVIGSENVTVSNCVLKSQSAGIRIGYGVKDVRNCVFENVVIDTSNRGIGIFVRGRGSVENVLFSNVLIRTRLVNGSWWGRGEPIHLSVLPFGAAQGGPFSGAQGGIFGGVTESGRIRNIRFSNVSAYGESGVVLYGFQERVIEDIALDGIGLRLTSGADGPLVGGNFDLRPSDSMETSVFKHEIPGVFAHKVHGLEFNDVNVEWTETPADYFSSGIRCEGVSDLVIDGFTGRQAGKTGAAIALDGCRGATVLNCVAKKGTDAFLKVTHPDGEPFLSGNDLRNSKKTVILD